MYDEFWKRLTPGAVLPAPAGLDICSPSRWGGEVRRERAFQHNKYPRFGGTVQVITPHVPDNVRAVLDQSATGVAVQRVDNEGWTPTPLILWFANQTAWDKYEESYYGFPMAYYPGASGSFHTVAE